MSESQTPVQDQRCQSRPSARNSVIPSERRFSKNYGADQQRLQISDLHLDKFANPATFACWKIRFKTEECTCSQFLTDAMLWINEVEMLDPVDDSKSSSSVRGIRMSDFEVLYARIASALNKIIHNTRLQRKVSLEKQKAQKEDRFLADGPFEMATWDVSRAHFHGEARRWIYTYLPEGHEQVGQTLQEHVRNARCSVNLERHGQKC